MLAKETGVGQPTLVLDPSVFLSKLNLFFHYVKAGT